MWTLIASSVRVWAQRSNEILALVFWDAQGILLEDWLPRKWQDNKFGVFLLPFRSNGCTSRKKKTRFSGGKDDFP